MKFTLRDLFWLVLVVALGLGWWFDHSHQRAWWVKPIANTPEARITMPSAIFSISASGDYTFIAGGLKAELRRGQLTSEGKSYGLIRGGDRIAIEPGRVTVNGTERKPGGG